MTIRRDI